MQFILLFFILPRMLSLHAQSLLPPVYVILKTRVTVIFSRLPLSNQKIMATRVMKTAKHTFFSLYIKQKQTNSILVDMD